jgi:hypothetical protein
MRTTDNRVPGARGAPYAGSAMCTSLGAHGAPYAGSARRAGIGAHGAPYDVQLYRMLE